MFYEEIFDLLSLSMCLLGDGTTFGTSCLSIFKALCFRSFKGALKTVRRNSSDYWKVILSVQVPVLTYLNRSHQSQTSYPDVATLDNFFRINCSNLASCTNMPTEYSLHERHEKYGSFVANLSALHEEGCIWILEVVPSPTVMIGSLPSNGEQSHSSEALSHRALSASSLKDSQLSEKEPAEESGSDICTSEPKALSLPTFPEGGLHAWLTVLGGWVTL